MKIWLKNVNLMIFAVAWFSIVLIERSNLYEAATSIKGAQWNFSQSIPLKFEHKLRRH